VRNDFRIITEGDGEILYNLLAVGRRAFRDTTPANVAGTNLALYCGEYLWHGSYGVNQMGLSGAGRTYMSVGRLETAGRGAQTVLHTTSCPMEKVTQSGVVAER